MIPCEQMLKTIEERVIPFMGMQLARRTDRAKINRRVAYPIRLDEAITRNRGPWIDAEDDLFLKFQHNSKKLLLSVVVVSNFTDVPDRGLDHGAYVPLTVMYPEADIPVLQISMPSLDPQRLLAVGTALRPLRDEGVLIIGSGFLTHGLPFLRDFRYNATPPSWSAEFDHWAAMALDAGDVDTLAAFRGAPAVRYAHPTTEHYAPLFVTLGAADSVAPVTHDYRLLDGPGQALRAGSLTAVDLGLADKTAFVTGGSHGIGLAIARALTAEGAHVVVCGRDAARLAQSGLQGVQADVTDPGQLGTAVDRAADLLGGLDLLVANVGGAAGGGLLESSPQDWADTFAMNVLHAAHAIRTAVPHFEQPRRRQRADRLIDYRLEARTEFVLCGREGRRNPPGRDPRPGTRAAQYPGQRAESRLGPLPRRRLGGVQPRRSRTSSRRLPPGTSRAADSSS